MTSPFASAFTQGWLMGAGLIAAIGAQNALVLRCGLARRHVGAVVTLCTLADWALIVAGVFGLGALLQRSPGWLEAFRWGGAAFLLFYGARSLRRAWCGASAALDAAGTGATLPATLATGLVLTFLNPHVYLDTVVLLGSVGAQQGDGRAAFALGAGVASAMWFSSLGYGAQAAATWLARPVAWRVIDAGVATVMFVIAAQLLLEPLAA